MLDKLKVAIVLVIIAAISGFLIWGTNELTYEGILQNSIEKERSYYKQIFDIAEEDTITSETLDLEGVIVEEITVYDEDGNVIGYIYKGSETNSYGLINVLIGITVDGKISEVIISKSDNTPLYVKKIRDDYLINFEEYTTENVKYDSSTGASFTYGSVKKFVGAASDYFNENRGAE